MDERVFLLSLTVAVVVCAASVAADPATDWAQKLFMRSVSKSFSEKVTGLAGILETFATGLENKVDKFNSVISASVGAADPQKIVDELKPILNLEYFFIDQCLQEVVLKDGDEVIPLNKGSVKLEKEHFELKGKLISEGIESSPTLEMAFEFTDLGFYYFFIAQSSFVPGKEREGFIALTFKGISRIKVNIKVPKKIKEAIKKNAEEPNEKKCFVNVIKTSVKLSDDIELLDHLTSSTVQNMFGRSPTEEKVKNLILRPESIKLLKAQVEKSLLIALDPVIKDPNIFCIPQNLQGSVQSLECSIGDDKK